MTAGSHERSRGARWLVPLVWGTVLIGLDRSFAAFEYPGVQVFADVTNSKADQVRTYLKTTREAPAIVVLGSSHALFGISPRSLLGAPEGTHDAYNFGIGGVALGHHETLLEELLDRGTPERVILAVDWFTFQLPPHDAGVRHLARMLDIAMIPPLKLERRVALEGEGAVSEDRMGCAVALSGERAVLGASGTDIMGAGNVGAVYVFEQRNERWREEAKLIPADGSAGGQFGVSVAIDGDTVLVGAWRDDDAGQDAGAAYVFVRRGGVWAQQAKLLPPDSAGADAFGWSVALDGDTALIGARQHIINGRREGAAFLFRRTGDAWRQEAKLSASDGDSGYQFGTAVSLDGGRALIGAPKHRHRGQRSGAVYAFHKELNGHESTGWVEEARLVAHDAGAGASFGSSVCLHGDRALVGASERHCAYVFARGASGWVSENRLSAIHGERLDGPVGLQGDTAVVVGTLDDGARTVYLFERDTELGWQRRGAAWQEFPTARTLPAAVALQGDRLLVGDLSQGSASGATLFYLADVGTPTTGGFELSLFEHIPLVSRAYRHRDDVRTYIDDALEGRLTLPFLREDGERDRQIFEVFQGVTIDEFGCARGSGRANPGYLRRRGVPFAPERFAVRALQSMLALCAQRGVQVDLVHVPEHAACHAEEQRYEAFADYMQAFAAKHDVPYHDFNRADAFPLERTELFFDSDHLNTAGADMFSCLLGERLGLLQAD